MHVHAFSPLEVTQGAATLGWPLRRYLTALRDAGLGSLPGTAAEVLDDEIRAIICPDKLSTSIWLEVQTFSPPAFVLHVSGMQAPCMIANHSNVLPVEAC